MARATASKPRARPPKARASKKRRLDPDTLPYAHRARVASDVFDFFGHRLPAFIDREFGYLDEAWSESNLFRALTALPDSRLKRAGITRAELPKLVLNAFHLLRVAKRQRESARPRTAVSRSKVSAGTSKRKASRMAPRRAPMR